MIRTNSNENHAAVFVPGASVYKNRRKNKGFELIRKEANAVSQLQRILLEVEHRTEVLELGASDLRKALQEEEKFVRDLRVNDEHEFDFSSLPSLRKQDGSSRKQVHDDDATYSTAASTFDLSFHFDQHDDNGSNERSMGLSSSSIRTSLTMALESRQNWASLTASSTSCLFVDLEDEERQRH